MNHIVLETDAPYLAPVPYRGRRNEPVYIWKTAEKVADTFGLTLDETVQITRKNALDLFKIPNKKALVSNFKVRCKIYSLRYCVYVKQKL